MGKTLIELNLREKRGINVVGVIQDGNVNISYNPSLPLPGDAIVILFGSNDVLEKLKGR